MGTVTKLPKPDQPLAVAYEPTDKERQVLQAWNKQRTGMSPLPRTKVEKRPSGSIGLSLDHPDGPTGTVMQMHAMGVTHVDYHNHAMGSLAALSFKDGVHNADRLDSLAAMVAGIKPRDQLESMLASQMAAIHDATMSMAARLHRAESIIQQEHAEKALNKFARTFTSQVEALKRYRSKGEQRVIVERVIVHEGGQAVVGLVERQGGAEKSA